MSKRRRPFIKQNSYKPLTPTLTGTIDEQKIRDQIESEYMHDMRALEAQVSQVREGYSSLTQTLLGIEDPYAYGFNISRNPSGILDTNNLQNIDEETYNLWDKNPIASTITDYYTLYTMGTGVEWSIEWPEVEEVIYSFWKYNKGHINQFKWPLELSLHGELFFRFFTTKEAEDGKPRIAIRSLDPATIVFIATDPEDTQHILYYHQRYFAAIPPDVMLPFEKFPDMSDIKAIPGYDNVVDFQPADPDTKYPVAQVQGQPGGVAQYDPARGFFAWITRKIDAREILHVKINDLSREKRGRSDLHRLSKWIREYQAFLQGLVRMSRVAQFYFMDVTVKGGRESVENVKRANMDPVQPGTIKIHGDMETWNVLTPDIQSAQFDTVAKDIRGILAAGSKLTGFMLGDSSDTSFAGGNAQFQPVVKSFTLRQTILRQMFIDMFQRVVQYYQEWGLLDKEYPSSQPPDSYVDESDQIDSPNVMVDPADSDFGCKLPEIQEVDLLERSTAANQLTRPQDGDPLVSDQTVQKWFDVDPRAMKAEIELEQQHKLQRQIEKANSLQKAGLTAEGTTPPPDGLGVNKVRQQGGTPPKKGPNAGGKGRQYPNHQTNPNTDYPERGN